MTTTEHKVTFTPEELAEVEPFCKPLSEETKREQEERMVRAWRLGLTPPGNGRPSTDPSLSSLPSRRPRQ